MYRTFSNGNGNGSGIGLGMTIEELQAMRGKLMGAMLRGESAIEFENRRTEFRSTAELIAQLGYIDELLLGLMGEASKFQRVRVVSSDKDL